MDARLTRMRQLIVVVGCLSLLAVGCGDDDETSATTPATTPATTAESPPPSAPGSTAAALVPEVICMGSDGEVYFAYDNESGDVVVVPGGDANSLTAGTVDDNPLLTTLFAPGRVDPAFWAFPAGADPLVWTLVGPDGVERTATNDSLGACPPGYPGELVDDPRTPALEIVRQKLSADGTSVEVQLELVGVPETSVCNPAFESEPVLVSIGDATSLPTAYEPTATVVAGPFEDAPSGGQYAPIRVYPLVVDQCSSEGVTVQSWSAADEMRRLTIVPTAPTYCARVDDSGTLTVTMYDACEGLPGTGGSSIRPK